MADEIEIADLERLSKIIRSAVSGFEGLQNAAGNRFNAAVTTLGINPADLAVVLTNSELVNADEFRSLLRDERRRRQHIIQQNDQLRASVQIMLDFISTHHPNMRQKFEREVVLPQWEEFFELVKTRVFFGRMPKNWMDLIASKLDTTVSRMKRWQSDLSGIPEEVMDLLRDLPPPDSPVADPGVIENFGRRSAPKTPHMTMQAAKLLFEGMSRKDVAKELSITENQCDIEWTAPPRCQIVVPREGALNWFHLWEMESKIGGHRQSGKSGSWKARALIRLGLPENYAFTADLGQADPERVEAMRKLYFETKGYAEEAQLYKAFETIALKGQSTRSSKKQSWMAVITVMRGAEWNLSLSNNVGGLLAARFNTDHGETFDIFETTRARFNLNNNAQLVLAVIRKAGANGMTQQEIVAQLPEIAASVGFRRHDLTLQRLIFDASPGQTPSIWVAADFKNAHPAAWEAAQSTIEAAARTDQMED